MAKERLRKYLEYKHLSVREFERLCNLGNGVASRLSKTTTPATIKKIENNSDLNIEWLLTGEGEMLKEQSGVSDIEIKSKDTERNQKLIPFYDIETTGGYNDLVSSSDTPANITGYVQAGGWFNGNETAAIRHVGDSMTEYPNGCILVVKEVVEKRLLVPGRNYVIETSEFRVTKRVQRGTSSNTIALYSTNSETYPDGRLVYEPFEVELEDIRHIFSILGYIVNQTGEYRPIKP